MPLVSVHSISLERNVISILPFQMEQATLSISDEQSPTKTGMSPNTSTDSLTGIEYDSVYTYIILQNLLLYYVY